MRLYIRNRPQCWIIVSIHASVKDATIKISAYPFRAYVSIHASVKDATEGEGIKVDLTHVSIHASVKDATPCL